MEKHQKPTVKLPPVEHACIVVKDIDRAIEYYSSNFGWAFQVLEGEIEGFTYRGQPGSCRFKMALTYSGHVQIELLQVLEGETPHTEFLREKGEGLQHLAFRVDDLDGMLAELAKKGIEPVFYQSLPDRGITFAYLNTDKIGGIMFELMDMK